MGQPGYAIYINGNDSSSISHSTELNSLIGNSGTLTLTQGPSTVTYSFTSDAFKTLGIQYVWDNVFEEGPLNAITVISPASSNFNTTDPITITITN